MKKPAYLLMLVLSQVIGLYALALITFPALGPPQLTAKFALYPLTANIHFLASALCLLIGPWLFPDRSRSPVALHRWLGRCYMLSILFGGLAGFRMAFDAEGGLAARAGFAMLALLWLMTAALALSYILKRNTLMHRSLMRMNFSLTFAAVTLRLYLPISLALGFDFNVVYPAVAWLCWVPNLLFALWLNRRAGQRANPFAFA